ncbi:MAG: hypothetical protein ACOX7U_02910 [Desulfitobacteriia bacterium]|jgi:ribonucleotide reductase beta subunit family protein with ferritin-like domain
MSKIFYKFGLVASIALGILTALLSRPLYGLIATPLLIILFYSGFGIYFWYQKKAFLKSCADIIKDKKIIIIDSANTTINDIDHSGMLLLTEDELVFKATEINLAHKITLVNNIQEVRQVSIYYFGYLADAFQVKLKDNTIEKYVVNNPPAWVASLKPLIQED